MHEQYILKVSIGIKILNQRLVVYFSADKSKEESTNVKQTVLNNQLLLKNIDSIKLLKNKNNSMKEYVSAV